MGLNPAHRIDQARRAKIETEQVRSLRKRPRGHCEVKTFIVPGAITTDIYVPPVFFGLDPDNTIPEVKLLVELRGMLRVGTCDITWTHNGAALTGSDITVTPDPTDGPVTLAAPGAVIAHGDYFQATIAAATDAADLSLALFVVTRQA